MELTKLHRLLCRQLSPTPEHPLPADDLFLQATGTHSFTLWMQKEQQVIQYSLLLTPDTLWVTQAGKRWPISLQDNPTATEKSQPLPSLSHTDICKAAMTAVLSHCALVKGQPIQSGEALYSLSAMKMQMVYYSPAEGVITAVHAKNGDTLSQGQLIFDWKKTPVDNKVTAKEDSQ